MKLATLKRGGRDGRLVVVADDHTSAAPAPVPTLQAALDNWDTVAPRLRTAAPAAPLDPAELTCPLPRAHQWAEASTYRPHAERTTGARDVVLAVYSGCSDAFLGPRDAIPLISEDAGLDLEATIAVVTGDVPLGTTPTGAAAHIKLVLLANDLTLREVFARNAAAGAGFFQAKPCRSFAPFAVTPDGLGDAWDGGRLRARLECRVNGELLGALDPSRDGAFSFGEIIAHMAATRRLSAGTIVGSGTVSNREGGYGCLAEPRAIERAAAGAATTPWLRFGDRVRIEAFADDGASLFGALDQEVVPA